MFQAHSALFKPGTPNVKDVYGSKSLLWLAGPLCSWCCRRAEASCPPSSSGDALHSHSPQASAPQCSVLSPREAFKATESIPYPTKPGFKLGRGHPACGLLETFCLPNVCVGSTADSHTALLNSNPRAFSQPLLSLAALTGAHTWTRDPH